MNIDKINEKLNNLGYSCVEKLVYYGDTYSFTIYDKRNLKCISQILPKKYEEYEKLSDNEFINQIINPMIEKLEVYSKLKN